MTFDLRKMAVVIGSAVAVATLGLTVPGSAAADSAEDTYLRRLLSEGVLFARRPVILQRAQIVCEALDAGLSPASVHHKVQRDAGVFTPHQTAVFVAITAESYCSRSGGADDRLG